MHVGQFGGGRGPVGAFPSSLVLFRCAVSQFAGSLFLLAQIGLESLK